MTSAADKIPYDALEEQAAAAGWEFFDGPAPQKGEAEKRARSAQGERVAQLAAALSTVPEFRELLDFLADGTLRRVHFYTGLGAAGVDPLRAVCLLQFHEGQKAMLMAIYKLIAQGRGQQQKGRVE